MKNLIFVLFLIFLNIICFGQSTEPDQDIRVNKERLLNLKDGVIKREISFFSISSAFYAMKDYPKNTVNEIPILSFTDTTAIFKKDSLLIKIFLTRFDTIGHTLTYYKSQLRSLALIDGKPFFGTDGEVPRTRIKSVIFQNGKQLFRFPAYAISGLYEPNFYYRNFQDNTLQLTCKVFQSLDKRRHYIYMQNSDGAGGYVLTWVIQDNKYLTRVIDDGF
jgi:hypothetical protein